jgi:hypothetical protein
MAVVAGVVNGGVTVAGRVAEASSPNGIKGAVPVERTGGISGGVELDSAGTSGGDDTCGSEGCLIGAAATGGGRGDIGCTVGGDASGGVIDCRTGVSERTPLGTAGKT